MSTQAIKEIFDTAYVKQREADEARAAMGKVMLAAMRNLLPEGTILNLDQRPLPAHLVRVRTMSGNDRRARQFRVVKVVDVRVDALRPELSAWACDAVPISGKTGKEMSGATHSSSTETVRLNGDIGYLGMDEEVIASRDRLVDMVAKHSAGA